MNIFLIRIITAFVILFPYKLYSQTISYSYDDAGNRIKRELKIEKRNIVKKSASENKFVTDRLSDKSIHIYPNPTKGPIKIEVLGFEDKDTGNISVFDLAGHNLFQKKIITSFTEVDLSSKPSGIYILQIQLNQEYSTWKIIKE